MKILCICPIGIGNYLLIYPACRMLKKILVKAELHLLALRSSIAEIAANDPLWQSIRVFDPTREKGLRQRAAFLWDLGNERFAISLGFFPSNNWQYNLVPFFCGIRERFAFGYPLKKGASLSFLNNHRLPIDPALHDVQQNIRFISSFVGLPLAAEPLLFPTLFTDKEREEVRVMIRGLGGADAFIGIHPGSSSEHGMQAKRWDPMRFGELADRICAVCGTHALIFGGPDEEKIKHLVASIMKAPRHLIPPLNLRMTAALLHECRLFLANDSGLMHIAASMGIPTAALFGPTDERRNGPVGSGHLVLRKAMDGFPLWTAATVGVRSLKSGIDPQASLKALSVEDAWEKVKPWLRTVPAKRVG